MFNWEKRDDTEYFSRRAREERAIALSCADNAVALVHLGLADAYDRKLTDHLPLLTIVN